MKKTWLLIILLLTFVLAMGLATGCGDDDGDDDAGTDTDTDTDTDSDCDNPSDAGCDCVTVTGTIGIGAGFPGPATALVVGIYENDPSVGEAQMPVKMSELIESPAIDSDTDYALSIEVCEVTDGADYYTAVAVFAADPGLPAPGDASGSKGPNTYNVDGTVDLGTLELDVVPAP